MGERLWLPAVGIAAAGLSSLYGIERIDPVLFAANIGPYAAAVALVAWVGRRGLRGAVIGLIGLGVMSVVSWCEASARQGPGFEWRFNNALQFTLAGVVNYVVLGVAVIGTLVTAGPATHSHPGRA